MGYDFSFKDDSNSPGATLRFASSQMSLIREAMRETGAATQQGRSQAIAAEGFEPAENAVSLGKFLSNDGWHVSPDECRLIADRLTRGLAGTVIIDLFSFYDDAPPDATDLVREFIDYNQRAAEHGGYLVK